MAQDILSEYGPDAHKPQASPVRSGGVTAARDVMGYQPPQGPTNINDTPGPGLHGVNHGKAGIQGATRIANADDGVVGLGGTNRSAGTQR